MRWITPLAVALMLSSSCAFGQANDRYSDSLGSADSLGSIGSTDDAISSALRELVVSSSEDLESYTISLKMEQIMDIQNLSTGESQQLQTRSIGFGLTNMTDRTLKIVMASLTYIPGDKTNSSAMALEEYLLNDTIYVRIDGNWTALQLYGMENAWSQQNTLDQQIDLFNQSRLTLIGSETVDGDECYRVRAEIDIGSYAEPLSREMAMYIPHLSSNSSEIFSNMTLEVDYWISKRSHLLRRADVFETLRLTPQSLGFTEEDDRAVNIRSNTSTIFAGFNESIKIVLPAEASSVLPFPAETYPKSEAAIVSSEGDSAESEEDLGRFGGNLGQSKGDLAKAIGNKTITDGAASVERANGEDLPDGGAMTDSALP